MTGNPQRPSGLQQVPSNATLEQAIQIINSNFTRLSPALNAPKAAGSETDLINRPQTNTADKGEWEEAGRQTELVRIFNPNDATQYVDVKRIAVLTLRHRKTGAIWKWYRGGNKPGDPEDEGKILKTTGSA